MPPPLGGFEDNAKYSTLKWRMCMKYFTSELWSKFSGASLEERSQVELEWDKACKEYSASFEKIKDRFSKRFLDIYFANSHFHDFHIKEFQIIHKKYGFKNPVSINLIVTDKIKTWKITYTRGKSISVNYKEEIVWQGTRWERANGFDDWGYDEFFAIDEDTLSHEILFASDASILIHFRNHSISISKNKDD
jgi:hypothetical protein